MPYEIPNAADAFNANQAEIDRRDILWMTRPDSGTGVISGCAVTAQGSPDMTVAVARGEVMVNGERLQVVGGNVTITTADGSNPRFDLICVDSSGAKSAVAGTPAAEPVFPDDGGKLVLATVYVPASDTTIASNQIYDRRITIPIRDVDVTQYGAIPDAFFSDGVSTISDATFTSATANFTSDDVGKYIVIERAGPSSQFRPLVTTISSVTSATEVELATTAGRSKTNLRFLISRGGDSTSAIQAAIDDVSARGGGRVYLPGPGYLITGLTIKNRVWLQGSGMRSCLLHQAASANVPAIQNENQTAGAEAAFCAITDLGIDGNGSNQSNQSVTLAAQYTAGNSTITLSSGHGALVNKAGALHHSGTGNRLFYTGVSGDTLSGVVGGIEATTDQTISNGQTLTMFKPAGILLKGNLGTAPADAEHADPHHLVQNVMIRNIRGSAIETFNQSENRFNNIWVYVTWELGFRITFDSWVQDCTSEGAGRMGFYSRGSQIQIVNCKVFNSGGVVNADGIGFLHESPTQPAAGAILYVNCQAQDNFANGFRLRNCDRITMKNCAAMSNGVGGTNQTGDAPVDATYPGLKAEGVNWSLIELISTDTGQNGGTFQTNAVEIDSVCDNSQFIITHARGSGSVKRGVMARAIKSTSSLAGGVSVKINSTDGAKTQTPATGTFTAATTDIITKASHGLQPGDAVRFTTSGTLPAGLSLNTTYYVVEDSFTTGQFKVSTTRWGSIVDITDTGTGTHSVQGMVSPDPYAATLWRISAMPHNIRVENAQNTHLNAQLRFIFVQDGTGGRTVTWGSTFLPGSWTVNPAPNGVSIIDFVFDGTNWIAANYGNEVVARGGSVLAPTGAVNVYVWRAPFACTVTAVKGIRRGGTGATINARRNGSSNHLSSALSLTSADTWMDGGAVQNTAYAAGDSLEIMIVSVSGAPSEVGVQVEFARA